MRYPAVTLSCLLLGGCSVTVPLVGRVGDDEALYRGTATGYMDQTGTIQATAPNGVKCSGNFRYLNYSGGVGSIRCEDGRVASLTFRRLSDLSGAGAGLTSDNQDVRLVYGMDEIEGAVYLRIPPKATAAPQGPNAGQADPSAPQAPRPHSAGSGFAINTQGQIVTNDHVAGKCKGLQARLADDRTVDAHLVAHDPTNDLAVIQVDGPVRATATFLPTPTYRPGDAAIVYGFPLPNALATTGVLTTGTVSATTGLADDSRFFQLSAPIQPGNSGGPVADAHGNVIGVATQKLADLQSLKETGQIPQNVNFAIKDIVVKAFLQSQHIAYTETDKRGSPSPADVGDMMKSFSVFIICMGD